METQCACRERYRAMAAGEFLLSYQVEGWVFVNGPTRRMSPSARYYAIERGVENHTGELYRWTACPWCGADLPPADTDSLWKAIQDEGAE